VIEFSEASADTHTIDIPAPADGDGERIEKKESNDD